MAPTHVELYEALKPSIGEKAAGLIAEVVPPAMDLATKLDIGDVRKEIADVRTEIAEFRGEMREGLAALRGETGEGFAAVRGEIQAEAKRTTRWMLAFFIPLWAGTWGTVVAVVLKG